jgi:hypothetical protein
MLELLFGSTSARRRRYRAQPAGPRIVIVLCASGLAAVVAMALFIFVWQLSAEPTVLPAPTCEAPARVRVFVLDSSDPPISPSQATAIDELLKRFLEDGRMYDRVMVGRLTPSLTMPLEILWTGCDTGQESEVSSLRVSPKEARRRREAALVAKVRNAVAAAKVPSPTPLSPIAESWSMLFKDQRVLALRPNVEKTVIFVTDALEHLNPPLPSAYRSELTTARAKAYFQSFIGSASNMRVTIGLLFRPDQKDKQMREAKPWLHEFLRRSGVERIEWVDLW